MNKEQKINFVAELAMEVEIFDRINWGELNINKEEAFLNIAEKVCNQAETVSEDQRDIVNATTITKLLVENMVLNILIEKMRDGYRGEKN